MKSKSLRPAIISIVLAIVAAVVAAAMAPQASPHALTQAKPPVMPLQNKARLADITARLERDIPRLMKEADVPGLSIALVRDGELAWHHGFGVMNSQTKEPVTDSTVFEAASLSKPVFA